MFIRAWLLPRVAFWAIWTAWLWFLDAFLLQRWAASAGPATFLFIVAPPLILTWAGSRLATNPLESPAAVFWKGAAVSCLLGAFANLFILPPMASDTFAGTGLLILAFFLSGFMAIRGSGIRKLEIKGGDLFERAQAIARRTGIPATRVLVFTSPRDTPAAFSQRTGAILLADRLLRILSRRETDAVIAHELAHMRPIQRTLVTAVPLLAGVAVFISAIFPAAKSTAPFWPIAAVLLWRAIRRVQEFDADAASIRATGDPEALITALARISHVTEMPFHWGRAAGLFLSHPPMTARFRAIARRGGIDVARLDQVVAAAAVVPPLPGYASPFSESVAPVTGILAEHHERLKKRMALLSKLLPIVAGVALPVTARSWDLDFTGWIALTAAWIAACMLLHWVLYECVVGSERGRLYDRLPGRRDESGYFVGLSTAAEPRVFDGAYHYDLGIAKIDGAALVFEGARCSFTLASGQVRRVWLADGPRHWTPRKTVCIEYRSSESIGVVSLQSMQRWFWPASTAAAGRLLSAVRAWSENTGDVAATVLPPQVIGTAVPVVLLYSAWKPVQTFAMISLAASWTISAMATPNLSELFAPFSAAIVTAALVLFTLAPHLQRSSRASAGESAARNNA